MKSDYHNLTVSISQAQTLGLEGAVLFHCLAECSARAGGGTAQASEWCVTPQRDIVRALPFWDAAQAWSFAEQLQAKGLIECAREEPAQNWRFRLRQTPPAASAGRRPIPHQWRPSAETLAELRRHHGIDEDFALAEVENFRIYQQERGESVYSWNNLFRKWALSEWRRRLQQRHSAMHPHWRPGEYALDELHRLEIPSEFIEEAIPEFICYWMEKDINAGTWNSKFINHIKNQWRRYQAELQYGREPRPIVADWRPSQGLYDMLGMANIPSSFAEELLPEFIFYWRERGSAMPAWNALFLRHIKREWARRHDLQTDGASERWQEFVAAHTDPSWRDDNDDD